LDWMILEVFSNLNDSMVTYFFQPIPFSTELRTVGQSYKGA